MQPGDVLVATSGVHRPRRTTLLDAAKNAPESPAIAATVATVAAVAAVLAAWYAARAGEETVRTVAVGILLACALVGVLPVGRHTRQRVAAAPAFAAAAAFAALYEPGVHLLPAILGAAGISAAVVAGIGRALAVRSDETSTVWIASGLTVFACCALPAMLGWDARVAWTLLVFLSMMAARFAPSLAIDVPDDALLDLDRLAVTAWSARDSQRGGRRGRLVVGAEAMESARTPRLADRHRRLGRDHGDHRRGQPAPAPQRRHRPRPDRRALPGLLRRLLAAAGRPVLPARRRAGLPPPGRPRRAGRAGRPPGRRPGRPPTSTPSSTSPWASGSSRWRPRSPPAAAGVRSGGRGVPRWRSRCAAASPSPRRSWPRVCSDASGR